MAVLILLFLIVSAFTIAMAIPISKYICSMLCSEPFHQSEVTFNIPSKKQSSSEFLSALIFTNLLALLFCLFVLMTQKYLPLNPQHLEGVSFDLALNIAVSFVTGTNWQTYSGEMTLSYFSQLILCIISLIAASSGASVAFMLLDGLRNETHGKERVFQNYWQFSYRFCVYVLMPLTAVFALILVSEGTIQNFSDYTKVTSLENQEHLLPQGPVAIFKCLALLGVSGGGFFGTNSIHPFENPTQYTNLIQIVMMMLLPTSLIFCYARLLKRPHQGAALVTFLYLLLFASTLWIGHMESSYKILNEFENLEGKEMRFGGIGSSIYSSIASLSSGGANTAYNSLSPKAFGLITTNVISGGFVLGGTGTGLLNLILFILLAVFFSGMMAGRIPKFLGKKIDNGEVKYIMIYVTLYQCLILIFTTLSVLEIGDRNIIEAPVELTKLLMTNTSTIVNNGSIFPSDFMSTPFMNYLTALGMIIGRYLLFYCMVNTSASLASKKMALNRMNEVQTDAPFFFWIMILVVVTDFLVFIPVVIIGPLLNLLSTGG